METQKQTQTTAPPTSTSGTRAGRRPFQTPAIVLERELKSLAQGIGPFSVSGTGP